MTLKAKKHNRLMKNAGLFPSFARRVSAIMGRPLTFVVALALIVVWGVSGPIFGFSDTWQLIINTSTTIVTFLMVFLIQNTQNRDGQAVQLKLDELIRVVEGAHNALIDLEELTDAELTSMHHRYLKLAKHGREQLRRGESDTGKPDLTP